MRVVALDWKQLFIYLNIREVANAHIAAARSPWAEGRYILAEKNMTTLAEMSTMLHRYPLLLPAQLAGDDVWTVLGVVAGLHAQASRNTSRSTIGLASRNSALPTGRSRRPSSIIFGAGRSLGTIARILVARKPKLTSAAYLHSAVGRAAAGASCRASFH